MNNIKTIIQNKYYRYQPGEFLPVYMDGVLHNRREFHLYKTKRLLMHIQAYLKAVHYNLKQARQQ